MRERSVRSDNYQHLYHETYISDEYMATFDNSCSIVGQLNPFKYDEKVLQLQDELKKEFWIIAEKCLTQNQKNIIKLKCDGYTQMEISKILNVNQSSVCKCINGNIDYSNGKAKVYGGIIKKMQKQVMQNPRIKELLDKINELQEERL